jgi:DNA polymerase III delta prime subunit
VTSLLPWPPSYLDSWKWAGARQLLQRCRQLHVGRALPSTLLLLGEPGLGREAVAVELACSLTCREGGAEGCTCTSCQRVRRGIHPDLAVLDVQPGKSDIVIEQVHQVVEDILQRPYEAEQRVFLVASVHTPPLNAHAASALLKTLEEPPSHVTFLLLAANPSRVLPTILSRSVQLHVPPPQHGELCDLLCRHHQLAEEQAEELLAAVKDASLALQADPESAPSTVATLETLLGDALNGDVLALLRLASQSKRDPATAAMTTASLLSLASSSDARDAERFLDAAAALITSERRRSALHLDPESTVAGTLARLLRQAASG